MSSNVDETEETNGSVASDTQANHAEDGAMGAPPEAVEDDSDDEAFDDEEDGTEAAPDVSDEPTTAGEEEEPEDFEEDGRADMALDFVVDVLTKMGMDCTVDLMENDDTDPPSDIRIEITGNDAGRLIGKKGQTLAALQFLTNRIVNRPGKLRRHILIDANGYRARRESALSSMAQKLGEQAVSEGKIITFEPMNAQDRRVVHLALAKSPGLITKSEGKGSTRRVQIIPVRED